MILSNDNCNLKLMQGTMHKTIEIEFPPSNNNTLITLAERVSLKMSQGIAHRNSKNSILINITLFPAKEFLLLMQYCIFSNNNKKSLTEGTIQSTKHRILYSSHYRELHSFFVNFVSPQFAWEVRSLSRTSHRNTGNTLSVTWYVVRRTGRGLITETVAVLWTER